MASDTESNFWKKRLTRRGAIRAGAVVGVGMAGAGLIACGGGKSGASTGKTATPGATGSTAAGSPKYGGTFLDAMGTTKMTITDPYRAVDGNTALTAQVFEPLFATDPATMALVPQIVASWEEVEVGLHYILHVQPGAVWENKPPTNGRPVDGEDVAYNLRYASGLETPDTAASIVRSSWYGQVENAKATDAKTVDLTLSKPNAAVLFAAADPRQRAIPKEMPSKLSFADFQAYPSDGPYLVKEWNDGVHASFVRNPNYYLKQNGNKLPYFDNIEVNAYGDESSEVAALLSGNLDSLRPSDAAIASMKNHKNVVIYPSNWRWYDIFYINAKRFPDSRVWQGLQRIINYQELIQTAHLGNANLSGPIDSALPQAYQPSYIEKQPGYNPATKAADIADGKKMLSAAGFPDGDGFKMDWVVPQVTTAFPWQSSIVALQTQFNPLLPKMQFTISSDTSIPAWTLQVVAHNFDATSYTIYDGPDVRLALVNLQTNASRNYANYSNSDVDALINKAFASPQSEMQGLTRQVEDILLKGGCPAIIWDSPKFQVVAPGNVKGWPALLGPGSDGDIAVGRTAVKFLWSQG